MRHSEHGWRVKPYPTIYSCDTRPANIPTRTAPSLPPWLDEYNFSIDTVELVNVLAKMGDTVKWPPRTKKSADQRDKTRWYEFHSDHGYWTSECITLRMEIVELLNHGHLTDLLTTKERYL